ncbi:hypothetical protein KC19_2G101400 [Ceratodon purpureus]|uniref:Uncharacterized protein n=1 Tax=Ceratodon purpureus TaxID=3225 RepID=A0A8T0ITU8_CERPU|nr:hypothetical protein KC19_2G101400 [Ceratodon purpureus]
MAGSAAEIVRPTTSTLAFITTAMASAPGRHGPPARPALHLDAIPSSRDLIILLISEAPENVTGMLRQTVTTFIMAATACIYNRTPGTASATVVDVSLNIT